MKKSKMTSKMPNFLRVIFFSQLFELIGFYGIQSILVLFLVRNFGYADPTAYAIFSLFMLFSCFSPIFAGVLADKIFGIRKMILLGGGIALLGDLVILFFHQKIEYFLLGVALMVLGTGYYKVNLTSLLGLCYKKYGGNSVRGFTFAHVGMNIGGIIGAILCGYGLQFYGWKIVFSFPILAVIVSMFIFFYNIRLFEEVQIVNFPKFVNRRIFGVSMFEIFIVLSLFCALGMTYFLLHDKNFKFLLYVLVAGVLMLFTWFLWRVKDKLAILCLMFFILCLVIFTVFFNQMICLLVMLIERNVHSQIFGLKIPSVAGQSINPIFIVLFGPILAGFVFRKLEILKIIFGFAMIPLSFLILYFGCIFSVNFRIEYIFCIVAIGVQAIGELLILPFVQGYVAILSPKNMISFMMGFLMFTISFSNVFVIFLNKITGISDLNSVISVADSLKIYQNAFLSLVYISAAILVIFVPFFILAHKFLRKFVQENEPF